MERIVLGYDGSRGADAALAWVADRVRKRPARVEVVIVANMFGADRSEVRGHLEHAERELRSQTPAFPVETHYYDGTMPRTLVDAAEGADLLVIGLSHAHPLRAALHGWMPFRISAQSSAKTCIVPESWAPRDGAVVVGLQDDDSSLAALDVAANEARDADCALHVVHAWAAPEEPDVDGSSALAAAPAAELAAHRAVVDAAVRRVRAAHPTLRVEGDLVRADPVIALKDVAAESRLVVIGTHQRGILAGGLLGSVAQDLIWELGAPLCVVPSAG
ncbi:universal stress protein [Microbacterium sp. X-17]|uniref:universal stress protein n=1 Tax=Microbacterium sp. X-17 TaxID=3144404 RepID=UPI0031F55E5B